MRRLSSKIQVMDSPDLPLEQAAFEQALALESNAVLGQRLQSMVLTPDLHVGPGIPVGMACDIDQGLWPKIIGKDIGCGMRLLAIENLDQQVIAEHLPQISIALRQVFFEGGRALFSNAEFRADVLKNGLRALENFTGPGIFAEFAHLTNDNVYSQGTATEDFDAMFSGYVQGAGDWSAEGQLGSLGGGNHFCELGFVDQVLEESAGLWGLPVGTPTILVHSGSLSVGAGVGSKYSDFLIADTDQANQYLQAMYNASNFALVNRLALSMMAVKALENVLETTLKTRLIWDAPHNFIEQHQDTFRHRKGATPALGPDEIHWYGQPVLIPGSMGDHSFVLAGNGNEEALSSGPHGAGRLLSRGQAARLRPDLSALTVVTPMDEKKVAAAGRRDLIDQMQARVAEEAPGAYKDIVPVIDAFVTAGAGRAVAKLSPLLTIKA